MKKCQNSPIHVSTKIHSIDKPISFMCFLSFFPFIHKHEVLSFICYALLLFFLFFSQGFLNLHTQTQTWSILVFLCEELSTFYSYLVLWLFISPFFPFFSLGLLLLWLNNLGNKRFTQLTLSLHYSLPPPQLAPPP